MDQVLARLKSFSARMKSESELLIREVKELLTIQFEAVEKDSNVSNSTSFDSQFFTHQF